VRSSDTNHLYDRTTLCFAVRAATRQAAEQ
jgi:hypothetical protein